MSIIQYRILFSVDLLHDYYLSEDLENFGRSRELREQLLSRKRTNYDIHNDLKIYPSSDTLDLIKNYNLIFKKTSFGFVIGTRVSQVVGSPSKFHPFIPLTDLSKLRFLVEVKNPLFYNFTNIPVSSTRETNDRQTYLFTNLAQNSFQSTLNLSRVIPAFDSNYGYQAGEIIRDGVRLFEATQNLNPNNAFNLVEWKEIYKFHKSFFNDATSFDRNINYALGATVIHNNSLWVARQAIPQGNDFDSNQWGQIIDSNGTINYYSPDPPNTYSQNDVVVHLQGVFVANSNTSGSFNQIHWTALINNFSTSYPQFATSQDRILQRPSIFRHTLSTATENHRRLRILLYDQNDVLLETIEAEAIDPSVPNPTLKDLEVNFSDHKPGVYRTEVQRMDGSEITDLRLNFYMDDQTFQINPLAIIECHHGPQSFLGDYRWLDETDNDNLLSPKYIIRWKNRSTFWKYNFRSYPQFTSHQIQRISADPTSLDFHKLISVQPIGLSQIPKRIEVVHNSNETNFLPNPEAKSIYPKNGRIFSEMDMGGGLGPPVP